MADNPIKRYRKKTLIEALQWHGTKTKEIAEFLGDQKVHVTGASKEILIYTLEGIMRAVPGCWIAKGSAGEFYPIQDDIFRETYEEDS